MPGGPYKTSTGQVDRGRNRTGTYRKLIIIKSLRRKQVTKKNMEDGKNKPSLEKENRRQEKQNKTAGGCV
jgi:hypothetical protein